MADFSRRTFLAGSVAAPNFAQVQRQEALNILCITVDTWGADWLGCYGAAHVRTPHVDALAAKSVQFLDAYPEVLPTIPARRALYTGRRIFPSRMVPQPDDQVKIRGWHPLYAEDVTLSETLRDAGYTTAFVSDVYHQFKPGKNFHRGFDSWQFIRGQEADRLVTAPRKSIDLTRYMHASQNIAPHAKTAVMQYLLNRHRWKTEDDWLAAQVFREAGRWLEENVTENQPFYLHVESFTPHEWWDPPESWYRQYMKKDYRGPWLLAPPSTTANMTPLEVEHARALYAALVSFTDARIGGLLEKVERLGLMKNTLIVFVGDHGTMMGEQDQLHKGETRIRTQVTHVPLLIRHPHKPWAGRRVKGFVQHPDIMPTLLDLVNVKIPARVTGESLVRLMESGNSSKRNEIVTGWGEHGAVRNPEWCYIGRWSEGKPFEELYDLRRDPKELRNVAAEKPKLAADLRARLLRHVNDGWPVTSGSFA